MNWNTGEEDGSGWSGLASSRDPEQKAFDDGVTSVISIRCMEHRAQKGVGITTTHDLVADAREAAMGRMK